MTHDGQGMNIFNQACIVPITAKCGKRLHGDAGAILGHSCIAVKMLALQGGIYNVCGMYNV